MLARNGNQIGVEALQSPFIAACHTTPQGSGLRVKPLTAREVERRLRENGFVREFGKGSHCGWYNPQTGRKTVVPHHGNTTLAQG